MRKINLLFAALAVSCAATYAQKAYTIGIATHHINFDGFGTNDFQSWQSTWAPAKLMVGIPLTEKFYIMPTGSIGTASYGKLPKDRLFWNLDLNLKYDLTKTKVQPFVMGGYGVTHVQADNYAKDFYGGPNVGGGFNFWLNDVLSIVLQYNYNVLPGYHNYHQGAVGLNFKLLTGPIDTDKDGVPDETDACPKVAGNNNGCPDADNDGVNDQDDTCPNEAGTAATKGCPDSDGDGIVDSQDKCPQKAGKAELGGCPDTDGDGIVDDEDQCPNEPGTAATKGCPDKDGDGVLDKDDKCPGEKGTAALNGCPDRDGDGVADKDDKCPDLAGVAERQGCPEIKEEKVKEIETKLNVAATRIQFDLGKSTIKSKSFVELDKIVDVMNEYTFTKFNIEGHTDNVGNAEQNRSLSQQRADAVRDYIAGKGIEGNRLTSTGFGQDRPIASNKTKSGQAKNRRVEIHLIQE